MVRAHDTPDALARAEALWRAREAAGAPRAG